MSLTAPPNVLVLSESPFTRLNGFGATLCTFFDGYPADSIQQLYPIGDYSNVQAMKSRVRRISGVTGMGVGGRLQRLRFETGFEAAWGDRYSGVWLKRFLGGWRPDVVYCFFFSTLLLDYGVWVSRLIKVPLILHAADEPAGKRQLDALRDRFQYARIRIAISDKMAAAYEARYGCSFQVAHNGAGESLFTTRRHRNDSAFIIRYVGSIHPLEYNDSNYWAIESVARAVALIAETMPNLRFELFGGGSMTRRTIERNPLPGPVSYCPSVDQSELFPLLVNADLLILPLCFGESGAARQQYSFSTKLPEYLGSGTPTLVYGPAENATVEYCIKNGLNHVVTQPDQQAIEAAIRNVIAQGGQARQAAAREAEHIRNNLCAAGISRRFQALLREACIAPSNQQL